MSEWFTLYLLDRRGRGASSRESAGPYSLQREAEDVVCIIESIGHRVFYLGHSYGALIGIEALLLTDKISKALLYELPFDMPRHTITRAVLQRALLGRSGRCRYERAPAPELVCWSQISGAAAR